MSMANLMSAPTPDFLAPKAEIVLLTQPGSATAESIRALRTRVQAQHIHAGRRALAVCGASPGVGCSFVAVSLAVALAQIGVKTLLMDANLRDPTVHSYFPRVTPVGGLHACLSSADAAPSDFTNADVMPNLDIMFAGKSDPASQELLAGQRFPDVINACLRDYEMTIIDTPPANACADCRRVATVAGFSLIVVRRDRSLVSDVKTLAGQLRMEHSEMIGTVLNDV